MDDLRQEFWGDLQVDLYTANTAVWLSNQRLEQLISTDGYKAHLPIVSHPHTGTYTPHEEISFRSKTARKQTLTVNRFEYAAEDLDVTESKQTPYDLLSHSLTSIRRGLMNRFEQVYLSEISNAKHSISGSPVTLETSNALDIFREAGSKLGSFDVPRATAMRAIVLGPNSVEILRKVKSERESSLGDNVLENGVIGPWHGWTVVENNNLPWSATLTMDTNPTADDTVTIAGVVFTFVSSLTGAAAGSVLIDTDTGVSVTRANLKAAVEGGTGAGTTYVDLNEEDDFILRRKRYVKCTSVEAMAFTGFGDIAVSETFTASTNVWSAQKQDAIFMVRGAIDAVLQFMDLEVGSKEKGFAKLPKGIFGMGAEMFYDGAIASVRLNLNASNFY